MKRLILILSCFLFIYNSQSQNYKTIRPDEEAYFINKDGYIRAINIDTSVITGTDTFYFNFHSIAQDSNNCVSTQYPEYTLNPVSPSWIGPKVIIKANGENVFFNGENRAITLQTNASLFQTWRLYAFADGSYIEGEVTDIYLGNVVGAQDSIKQITLHARDSSGNPISHDFNAKTFLLSKNHGWLRCYNMLSFPDDTVAFNCTDIKIPTVGEIYYFEIGDQIQIEFDSRNSAYPKLKYTLKTYLDKRYSVLMDTVTYTVAEDVIEYVYDYENYQIYFDTTLFYSDTVIEYYTDLNTPIIDGMPEESIANDDGDLWDYSLNASNNYNYRTHVIYKNYNCFEQSDSCWTPWIDGFYYTRIYIAGLGKINQTLSALSGYYNEEIVYYKKGQEIFGELFTSVDNSQITTSEIEIYPNPAYDQVYVKLPSSLKSDFPININLYDLRGQLVLTEKRFLLNEVLKLKVSGLRPGFYFVSFETNTFHSTCRLIVQ